MTTKGTVSPTEIAEHILWLRRDQETTPLHIVKLVYLCHGWMLGIKGVPLLNEPVITGQYGPVLRSLYERYAIFGDGPIVGSAERVDHTTDLESDQLAIVNFVHTVYEEYPDTELSELTHDPETPWSEIVQKKGLDAEIPDALIQEHYDRMVQEIRHDVKA